MSRFPVDTARLATIDSLETGAVWVLKQLPTDAFFTIGTIATDWDGDPMAYANLHKHKDLKPHDHLGNAGHPGNWWGVVTDTGHKNGHPIEQSGVGPAQPYKDYYISTTKLVNTTYKDNDVRRWTDASTIPYVALPNSRRSMGKLGLKPGCYCLLVDLQTMRSCFAVYADSKAATPRMGEISARATEMLGNKSGSVFILVFPTSGQGQGTIPNEATIQAKGREELKAFSYMDADDDLVKAVRKITNLSSRIIQAGYSSTTTFVDVDFGGDDLQVTGTFGRSR